MIYDNFLSEFPLTCSSAFRMDNPCPTLFTGIFFQHKAIQVYRFRSYGIGIVFFLFIFLLGICLRQSHCISGYRLFPPKIGRFQNTRVKRLPSRFVCDGHCYRLRQYIRTSGFIGFRIHILNSLHLSVKYLFFLSYFPDNLPYRQSYGIGHTSFIQLCRHQL